MQLEFHQLDRRWEHLRVHHPARQRRLLASLAESGQQTPIVVVAIEAQTNRFVVIDGYKRIAALEQLGRDAAEAVVWAMTEAAALLLDRSLRMSEHETALEVGWLLAELEQRFGYSLDELARRFDRSGSWVSRRLALVEVLPETIQQQVRDARFRSGFALFPVGKGPSPTELRRDDGWRDAEWWPPSPVRDPGLLRPAGRPAPAAAFSKTVPARRGCAHESGGSRPARRHRVVRLAACRNDAG